MRLAVWLFGYFITEAASKESLVLPRVNFSLVPCSGAL